MQRDQPLWRDDLVDVVIDTFAEMAIPFSTHRFDPVATAWGVNVKPFAVGTLASPPSTSGQGDVSKNRSDFGLDAKWAPVRAVSVDLTVNTDSGETEADDLQTNLSRFSLFKAKKREFFLENSGIFEFGSGAAGAGALSVMSVGALSFGSSLSSGSAPLLKLSHSRQIGFDGRGVKVPIDFGVRTTGRLGRWNIGLLGVQTDVGVVLTAGRQFPRTNVGAVRVSRNLSARSAVGMIVTDRNGGAYGNRSYGLDLHLRPSKSLAIDSYAAGTDTSATSTTKDKTDWSGGLNTTWNGPVAHAHAQGGWVHLGEDFDPQMGFLLRRGQRPCWLELPSRLRHVSRLQPDVGWPGRELAEPPGSPINAEM